MWEIRVELINSAQILLYLCLPENHIKYALFTCKNIFQRLKSRYNEGENYIYNIPHAREEKEKMLDKLALPG